MEKNGSIELFMKRLTDAQRELRHFVSAALIVYPSDVDDVVQDANYSLIQHAQEYQPERPFLSWAIPFARNQIRAYCKKRQREKLVFDDDLLDLYDKSVFTESEDSAALSQQLKNLPACMERLPERLRRLVDKHYFQGRTLVQIAKEENKPESTLHVTLFRARKALSDCIKRLCRLEDAPGAQEETIGVLDELTGRVIDSRDSADAESLFRQLRGNPAGMHVFAEQLDVHLLLTEWNDMQASRRETKECFQRRRARPPAARFGPVAAIAACLGLLFLGGAAFWQRNAQRRQRQEVAVEILPAGEQMMAQKPRKQADLLAKAAKQPTAILPQYAKTACTTNVLPKEGLAITAKVQSQGKLNSKGEKMMTRKMAAAATVATAAILGTAAAAGNAAAEVSTRVVSAAGTIDTRFGDTLAARESVLETRLGDRAVTQGNKTIDTSKPLGTVVMLM